MQSLVVLRYAGFAIVAVACLFTVIATCGNYWMEVNIRYYQGHSGLWRACRASLCYDVGDVGWLRATRAFMILSCLAYGDALILGIIVFVKRNLSSVIMGVSALSATIFSVIGLSVYTGSTYSGFHGWSFALGWMGFVSGLIGSVILLAVGRYEQLHRAYPPLSSASYTINNEPITHHARLGEF